MVRVFSLAFLCALALMFLAPVARADDAPPVFDKRPYADAKKAAADAKKWFIVKATAVWCGPCKQMDKTTWRDEKVVEWAKQNAVVVALDVDKHPKLARQLNIEAMPTMVAFKEGGDEFDRVVGYKAPDQMLAWLEGVAKGEKSIEAVKKRAKAPAGEAVNVRARMDLARSLAQDRKHADAADEYVWLWNNMLEHQPSMAGVRVSFMAGDMERLAVNEKARAKFIGLRDETGKRLEGEKIDQDDLHDWIVLNNRVLGDTDATVKWYDRVKDQPRWQPLIQRSEYELTEMFVGMGRWADVGRLSSDPLADLESDRDMMEMMKQHRPRGGVDEETRKYMEEAPARMFREKTGRLYAGLLAAGRENVAEKYAVRAREHDPSTDMLKALITTALDAEQARPVHKEWIAKAKDDSLDELAERVAKAVEAKQRK
ncbi:MAG TPA: thioredoxin family protein [Phycisphaerales bacterium]|nr:thioredoxin family protein [Phycisphaerales bacterium]